MSRLKIRGKLHYIPGPWGMNEPVKGASIKIIDKDPGGHDDLILTKTTNSLGKFSGLSKEWKDKRRIRYWSPMPFPGRWKTRTVPDPTDIMLLELDIKEGSHHFRGPFIFLGNNVEVPIVVPWGKETPPELATVKVNGVACDNGIELQKKARAAFESGTQTVKIEIRGPEALPFIPFAGKNLTHLKELVDDIMPGAKEMLYSNPIDPVTIAIIILAIGAATSVTILSTAVGVSLIVAISLGYDVRLNVVPGNAANPLPGIDADFVHP